MKPEIRLLIILSIFIICDESILTGSAKDDSSPLTLNVNFEKFPAKPEQRAKGWTGQKPPSGDKGRGMPSF